MEGKNIWVILLTNFRLVYKSTMVPAVIILILIPFVYGTSNLDSIKSAECLERMVALIGIPMFDPLLHMEQQNNSCGIIALRRFPFRAVVLIRMGISLVVTILFILLFEIYMWTCNDIFPFFLYEARTLVAGMILGLPGLFFATIFKKNDCWIFGSICRVFFCLVAGYIYAQACYKRNKCSIVFLDHCYRYIDFLSNWYSGQIKNTKCFSF